MYTAEEVKQMLYRLNLVADLNGKPLDTEQMKHFIYISIDRNLEGR